jgi:hypothetical protein
MWENFKGLASVAVAFFVVRAFFSYSGEENLTVENINIVTETENLSTKNIVVYENKSRSLDAGSREDDRLVLIKNIADSTGYAWATNGATFYLGCPQDFDCFCSAHRCPFGLIQWVDGINRFDIWIIENAFKDTETLKYTVLHEIAHVWQIKTRGSSDRWKDFSQWDFGTVDPYEATADCLAFAWGATVSAYYDCPIDAQLYIHQLYLESSG